MGAVVAAGIVLGAGPALAHVSIDPGSAAQGGFATFAFQVPNEEDAASTTQLEVEFPADHPIPFVSVEPVTGWTIDIEKSPLPEPVEGEGGEITEAVSTITWSGGTIGPGEFQQFLVSAGPLPDDTDHLEFKALQTYDNGDVVRWIQETPEGGEEPDFPAPVLELTPSTGDEHSDGSEAASDTSDASEEVADTGDSDDDDSNGLAIVALVVGAVGLVAGGAALVMSRRRPTSA
ncbi:MAG: YcnI family protein, partial [Candidatus Rokuibacteriota bacterium]